MEANPAGNYGQNVVGSHYYGQNIALDMVSGKPVDPNTGQPLQTSKSPSPRSAEEYNLFENNTLKPDPEQPWHPRRANQVDRVTPQYERITDEVPVQRPPTPEPVDELSGTAKAVLGQDRTYPNPQSFSADEYSPQKQILEKHSGMSPLQEREVERTNQVKINDTRVSHFICNGEVYVHVDSVDMNKLHSSFIKQLAYNYKLSINMSSAGIEQIVSPFLVAKNENTPSWFEGTIHQDKPTYRILFKLTSFGI